MGSDLTRRAWIAGSAGLMLAQRRPPNVIFLMSDQHQRGASGIYGNGEVRTPALDAIGAGAARFERAYCQAPVCVPARGSLVTGLYPHRHGAKILQDPLPASIPTIADFFSERGYNTAAIGKMHFVDENERHGFRHRVNEQDFERTLSAAELKQLREDQGAADAVTGKPSRLDGRYFQDAYFADQTVRFMREHKNRPFLLFSSFVLPHTPLAPLREFFDLYKDRKPTLPVRSDRELEDGFPGNLIRARERGWYTQTDDELSASLRGYYGNISQMDSYAGRIFETLRELRLDANTLLVYTSDHGEMAGAHRMWTKHNLYEESVGVPLMIRFPGRVGQSVHKELIEHVDLFPTVAELAGFQPPKGLHGRSFAGLLTGHRYSPREFAYSEYYFCRGVFTKDDRYVGKPPMLVARTNQWKLNYLSWDRCELYDVRNDPHELHNRIDDVSLQGEIRELTRMIERMYKA
jgi:choline-sulfatase